MKRIILFVLIVCLCLTACGGAVFGEVDQSAEELWKAGEDAWKAKDYDRAMEYYQMAADQGNAEGWRSIGSLYYNAEGVEQSSEKALKYWQRAADQGDAKALTNLALLYRKGEGVELDYEKAMEYYQQAVDGGDTKGLIGLGTMYYGGDGVEQSYEKAMEYWQQAADQGDTDAMVYIAYLYGHGEGVAQDFDKTMELYQRAAALGNLDATAYIGNMYLFGDGVEQDYAKAAEYYIPAAEAGNAYAQSNLAWLYTTGNGVALDQKKAAAYYQQAAEQGYSYAQANLASMYAEGKGVEQDYAKALEYYQLAADQGNGHAYAGLGDLYAQGNGVEQDDAKALEYYRQAADQGSDYALAALGALYAEGKGVEQDYAKALEYYRQAADQDVPEGFYGLGELYAEGNGVEKDEKKAIEYYRRAARGNDAAEDALEATAAEAPTFEEKAVKVFTDGKEAGELPLRFYDATPDIPYLGFTQYAQYIFDQPLTLRTGRDGVCVLANEAGVELLCDADLGVIVARDWNGFCDLPFPLENRGRRWKDTSVPFVRVAAVEYEGTPKPVVLDFAKYGIRIYSDESDVYLPVSTLTNMMADIATNHLLYNGENLYAEVVDLEGNPPEGFFDSGRYAAELNGEERPADIVAQSYADLCFAFDYFFGHPGIAALDDAIAGVGLDRALNDLGEAGAFIRHGQQRTGRRRTPGRIFHGIRNVRGAVQQPGHDAAAGQRIHTDPAGLHLGRRGLHGIRPHRHHPPGFLHAGRGRVGKLLQGRGRIAPGRLRQRRRGAEKGLGKPGDSECDLRPQRQQRRQLGRDDGDAGRDHGAGSAVWPEQADGTEDDADLRGGRELRRRVRREGQGSQIRFQLRRADHPPRLLLRQPVPDHRAGGRGGDHRRKDQRRLLLHTARQRR